jgi:hypothetical protein
VPRSTLFACRFSYTAIGPTSRHSSTTAIAEATGQSLLEKNSVHSVCPIIRLSEPPSRSGMTNSPVIGMKHRRAPAPTPGSDSGTVIFQNAVDGRAPRSAAASSSEKSIFSSVA